MTSREQFEAYYRDRECLNAEQAALCLVKEQCGGYTYRDPNEVWKAWQASRAAIEVKLPDDGIEDCEAQWGERCRNTFDCGYNFASVQHEKAMQAAGIKVEG